MISSHRAVRSALVIMVGALGIAASASSAAAQRRNPQVGYGGSAPEPRQPTVPYPGATVTVDPSWYQYQMRQRQMRYPMQWQAPFGYYIPTPAGYGYGYGYGYGAGGYGGGVTDVNGRPLYIGSDPTSASPGGFGLGTPNLTGAPYVVRDGGAMTVDFGNGDRRIIPSCAALAAERNPDGQPRTIFYNPPADALILQPGQSGRVAGDPPPSAAACYTADPYGRVVLDW
jgi:hypothetical protein